MHPICLHLLCCIDALESMRSHKKNIDQLIVHYEHHATLNPKLLHTILTGSARYHTLYQHWVKKHCKFKKKDQDIIDLLVITLYQLHHLENVNKTQLIYHATEACKKRKKRSYSSVVNAILHQSISLSSDIHEQDPMESIPDWLDQALPSPSKELYEVWLQPPTKVGVRINTLIQDQGAYIKALEDQHITVYKHTSANASFMVDKSAIHKLPGLKEHKVYIQDPNQQAVTNLLPTLAVGAHVLDACAAPGGKAGALINQQPQIKLHVIDKNPEKLPRTRSNLEGISSNITFACEDATKPDTWKQQRAYHAILLDAPCSATGTLQQNPEIRLLHDEETIHSLAQEQLELLHKLWTKLAPEGYLLYSTCSILPKENHETIQRFTQAIAAHKNTHKAIIIKEIKNNPQPNIQGNYACLLQKVTA